MLSTLYSSTKWIPFDLAHGWNFVNLTSACKDMGFMPYKIELPHSDAEDRELPQCRWTWRTYVARNYFHKNLGAPWECQEVTSGVSYLIYWRVVSTTSGFMPCYHSYQKVGVTCDPDPLAKMWSNKLGSGKQTTENGLAICIVIYSLVIRTTRQKLIYDTFRQEIYLLWCVPMEGLMA